MSRPAISFTPRVRQLLSREFALMVLLIVTLSIVAQGQVLYGSLVGTVTDSNGATVPGAKVEITNVATGNVSTVISDDRGGYLVNDLQAGNYKVTVSKASFKTTLKENVLIEINNTYRFDAQLEV